jgi:hypothetical protein
MEKAEDIVANLNLFNAGVDHNVKALKDIGLEGVEHGYTYNGKPISNEKLLDMIIKRKAKWVTFGNDNESETFSEHEICYITVVNKSIFVRLKNDEKDEEHMFLGSLTKTLEKLNGAIFYRIGRSMIVNVYEIIEFTNKQIVMSTGRAVTLTKNMKKEEIEALRARWDSLHLAGSRNPRLVREN